MISRTSLLPLLAVAALGLAGCDYFRPAQPEVGPGLPPVRTDYSSPEKTLETLQLAIQDKSATNGQSAYIGGFADPATDGQGFSASFDDVTLGRFTPAPPPAADDWDYGRELNFYSRLSQRDVGSDFIFGWGHGFPLNPPDEEGATTATLYRSYSLRAQPENSGIFVNEALGFAEIHFILVDNKWKIVKWIDLEDPSANFEAGQRSFGFLRLSGS